MNTKHPDFFQHLEAFLSRRDGVDKSLKIIRYTTKILLASSSSSSSASDLSTRLTDFESSVGTARKAFRLGKFVQDLNALRFAPPFSSRDGFLHIIAYGGEGIYYFVEQFVWLTKSGLLDKRHQKKLQNMSAWAEFLGYFGSITLKSLQLQDLLAKEPYFSASLSREQDEGNSEESRLLTEIHKKQTLKMLSIIQDFADAILALSDISDGKGVLSNPFLLSSFGLISALISTHKNWSAC